MQHCNPKGTWTEPEVCGRSTRKHASLNFYKSCSERMTLKYVTMNVSKGKPCENQLKKILSSAEVIKGKEEEGE